ncbi:MAG TPA: 4-hydroxy-tetrahydrodipicolinate synthase [Acidimicrobiales bacterium]|nr:4-hydroxy-tetrahydrodipicolinate synthase [Acidimicrobiales bacterium]
MARFGAVITAMVTPFDGEGALDLDAAAQLARWLAEHGSEGLVVAGTTGEGSTLTDGEKLDLWRAVAEAVTIPVIVNTGSNDTAHSVHLTAQAAGCGAAGVLAVTPYYNRPSQAGIEAHFRAIAAATDLPVLLYDIPVRSGRKIAHDVMVRLAHDVPNMAGVKDAANDVAASARLIAAVPERFEVYSGNDDQTLPLLAVGAVGVVSVAAHWIGREMAEMIAAFGKGDVAHAREVNARLLESYLFETGDAAPNPVPTKAMMRTLGLAVGECRLPMGPTPEGLEDRAREVYAGLHA